jgi:hypothetical protein
MLKTCAPVASRVSRINFIRLLIPWVVVSREEINKWQTRALVASRVSRINFISLLIPWLAVSKEKEVTNGKFLSNSPGNRIVRTCQRVCGRGFSLQGNVQNWKQRPIQHTSKALSDSFSIHTIEWSVVALQDRTMCSNRPSTGTAVLTSGGYRPHLHGIKMSLGRNNKATS